MTYTKSECTQIPPGTCTSDVRCIKSGWYAMDHDGNLSSGPFPSHEECFSRITQPTNGFKAFNRTVAAPLAGVERAAIDRGNALALFPQFR